MINRIYILILSVLFFYTTYLNATTSDEFGYNIIPKQVIGLNADELVLADNSSVASIVIGIDASEIEKYAVFELQRCILLMSGVMLSVVNEGASVSGAQIIIGTPATNSLILSEAGKLKLDGTHEEQIAILREGDKLYFGGQTPRAALYATYTFLEDVLGVRWFWPGISGEFIPKRNTVSVNEVNVFETPAMRYRSLAIVDKTNSTSETDTWMARNRMNLISIPEGSSPTSSVIANRLIKGFQTRIAGHNIKFPASILASHPEYVALYGGSRSYTEASKAQLCWGNAGVQEEVAKMITGWWNNTAFIDVVHFYPADNQRYCQCQLCKDLGGDVSTRWQNFSQIVMEKVDKTHPDKRYWTYAYQGYKSVPTTVASRFELIGYTMYDASYRHLLTSNYSGNTNMMTEINGWISKGASIGIRGYEYIIFKDPMFVPLVSWEVDQMKWIASKGPNGGYLSELPPYNFPVSTAPENTTWNCNRMNLYAAAKAMWKTTITPDSIINDWCRTVYGPAGDAMRSYYLDIEQLWRNAPGSIKEYTNSATREVDNFLSESAFERLNGYFSQARTQLADISDASARNKIETQIALENKMLANWQKLYIFKKGRGDRFKTNIAKLNNLDDASWTKIPTLAPLEVKAGLYAEDSTEVSMAWTSTDLALRITCQDKDIANRIVNAITDDGNITDDDCIELFIQPNLNSPAYMHFAVNTLGKKYDAISEFGGTNFDKSWNPDWTASTSVNAEDWIVNIKIPFSALGIMAQDSSQFKVAVKRSRAGRAENSGWPDASYFNPAAFSLATLVSEIVSTVDKRIILYDNGMSSGQNVSVEFQLRGWDVVAGVTGEVELRQKLNEDAAVLLLKNTTSLSTNFYLNEIKNFIEKGRLVVIAASASIPLEQWFPGTPRTNWSGSNKQASSPRTSTYVLSGSWQTTPNNLVTLLTTRSSPLSAYIPQSEGWQVLAKMRMTDGSDQPFLLTRNLGKGLLVLTSSAMGYSGGYEMFGSRYLESVVSLIENLKVEKDAFGGQSITIIAIPQKTFGEPDFAISATSSSGLPVALSSSDTTVAIINDGRVFLKGIGVTTITASQAGNENYRAAENVSQVLVVGADKIAPTVPGNLSATTLDSTVTLSWDPSSDFIGVRGYNIYQNNELVGTSSSTVFELSGLNPFQTYTFRVAAYDAAGNRSIPAMISYLTTNSESFFQTISDEGFTISPNPSDGNFKVNINTCLNGEVTILIFNASGTLIKSLQYVKDGAYQKEVEVPYLTNGPYIVRVVGNGFTGSRTIVINN